MDVAILKLGVTYTSTSTNWLQLFRKINLGQNSHLTGRSLDALSNCVHLEHIELSRLVEALVHLKDVSLVSHVAVCATLYSMIHNCLL